MDIGPKTVELFKDKLKNAKTVVWNGPLGIFEIDATSKGTEAVAQFELRRLLAQGLSRSRGIDACF